MACVTGIYSNKLLNENVENKISHESHEYICVDFLSTLYLSGHHVQHLHVIWFCLFVDLSNSVLVANERTIFINLNMMHWKCQIKCAGFSKCLCFVSFSSVYLFSTVCTDMMTEILKNSTIERTNTVCCVYSVHCTAWQCLWLKWVSKWAQRGLFYYWAHLQNVKMEIHSFIVTP